ncbi:MAG: aminoglycoside phosphotransferase family protein [Actinobacteria bacterium]|nr:aminoglycoside phosphotransferase family protein [Actinomycetota bacterium]
MTVATERLDLGAEAIPAPPPDAALPALPVALSAAAMLSILQERFGAAVAVRACTPSYIRYKPRTSCIVAYRLALQDAGTGREFELPAQVKLFAGSGARKRWTKGSLQQLARQVAAARIDPDVEHVALLADLGATLQVYPVDEVLPELAFAASDAGRRWVLRHVLREQEPAAGGIELIRYKPARKALLRYGSSAGAVYAKLYAGDRGGVVLRAELALETAAAPTATALAYLPDLRMLVHAEAPGIPLSALRGTARFDRGLGAAGSALERLQAVGVPDLPVHTWADEAAELVAAARAVAVLRPDLAVDATRLADRAIGSLVEVGPELTTSHGDFSDDQVLVAERGAVVLDLDEIRAAHPLLDVGNFLAHLSVTGAGERARASFLEAYGGAPDPSVAPLEAGALLKLAAAPFRTLEPDWPEQVEERLRLAKRRLAEQGRARSPRRSPRFDAALPQLAVLTDPALVGLALERDVYGRPVEVRAVEVVRHKPGRRCTLRYDLWIGTRTERVFAKTFASERGPGVFATLHAIADADPFDSAIELPEPIAYLAALKLLLQREVRGVPVRAALLAGDEDLAARIAEAIHALHASSSRRRGSRGDGAPCTGTSTTTRSLPRATRSACSTRTTRRCPSPLSTSRTSWPTCGCCRSRNRLAQTESRPQPMRSASGSAVSTPALTRSCCACWKQGPFCGSPASTSATPSC